ncbi:GNAT family N-acetyltransferase [Microbacterium sp. HJ5]
MSDAHVRRVLATDGERLRALRLEALTDPAAGIAFLETYDEAAARGRDFWDARAIGAALSGSSAQFIAEVGAAWVGTVTILVPEPGTPDYFGRVREEGTALAVAVYVSPGHRGRGILEELVAAGSEWARHQGCDRLLLDVHQENGRAQAAYRRLGFTPTGGTIDGQNGRELEMSRALPGG